MFVEAGIMRPMFKLLPPPPPNIARCSTTYVSRYNLRISQSTREMASTQATPAVSASALSELGSHCNYHTFLI